MGTWTHRIMRYDETEQECATCGVQPLKIKGGRPKCRVAVQKNKGRRKKPTHRWADLMVGACEICGATTNLVADHNHGTDEYRGTLCGTCNSGIGLMQDNPLLLRNALEYLEDRGHYG